MSITAAEIQQRRLTALTVVRVIGLLLAGYSAFALLNLGAAIFSGEIGVEPAHWWWLVHIAAGAAPLIVSLVAPFWLARLLVPDVRHDACGNCGYSLDSERPRSCPECGIELVEIGSQAPRAEQVLARAEWHSRLLATLAMWLRIAGWLACLYAAFAGIQLAAHYARYSEYYAGEYYERAWIHHLAYASTAAIPLVIGLMLLTCTDRVTRLLLPRPEADG